MSFHSAHPKSIGVPLPSEIFPSFSGDLDLISELLPDLTGYEGLSPAREASSMGSSGYQGLASVDTTNRPVQVTQAELDSMAAGHHIAVPYRDHAASWPGHIYGEAGADMAPQSAARKVRTPAHSGRAWGRRNCCLQLQPIFSNL